MNWSIFSDLYICCIVIFIHIVLTIPQSCIIPTLFVWINISCLHYVLLIHVWLLAVVSSSIDGFVSLSVCCLSVCVRVCVCVPITPFLPCSYYLIFMKFTPDIGLIKCFWPIPFQVTRSKVEVTGIIQFFVVSAPIWPVCFIFGTNMFCSILTLSLLGWITSYVAYIQHMTEQCVINLFSG